MDYIFKPMSYVLVIMLGYLLKRGLFRQRRSSADEQDYGEHHPAVYHHSGV